MIILKIKFLLSQKMTPKMVDTGYPQVLWTTCVFLWLKHYSPKNIQRKIKFIKQISSCIKFYTWISLRTPMCISRGQPVDYLWKTLSPFSGFNLIHIPSTDSSTVIHISWMAFRLTPHRFSALSSYPHPLLLLLSLIFYS